LVRKNTYTKEHHCIREDFGKGSALLKLYRLDNEECHQSRSRKGVHSRRLTTTYVLQCILGAMRIVVLRKYDKLKCAIDIPSFSKIPTPHGRVFSNPHPLWLGDLPNTNTHAK
jgi:hypothetical protein